MNDGWRIGDRLTDPAWLGRIGEVVDVDDYGDSVVVVTVHWQDGGHSDFTPGPETQRAVGGCGR